MIRKRDRSDIYASFAVVAQEYCAAIEDESNRGEEGLTVIRGTLLRLYGAALALPCVESDETVQHEITHERWQQLFKALSSRLPLDFYWDTFNPLENPPDTVVGSLADDLTDIWRDLKTGLLALQAEFPTKPEAVWWHWRFNFQIHWGQHAVGALRAMHHALQDD